MNEMELQTTLDPIEMDMGDPVIEYSPVYPNPEGDPTDDLTKVQIQGNIYKVKDPEVHEWARAEEKPTYTKDEVGLGNVDNTSDMDKPVSTATQTALDNKVDKVAGKGLSTNDFTNDFKTKLEGIEAGAEVNTVNSVAGKTGNVTLNKSDVGLGNVDNTSDMNKPVSTATQTALNGKVDNSTLNNYYTKTQTDSALSLKADSSSVYTKTEADNLLNGKVDKVEGYGLSENDFTDTLKSKLDGIEAEANKTIIDNALDGTSSNPVENRVVKSALDEKLNADETAVNSNGLVIATPVTDTTPYIYRQAPVKESFKALMHKIVGASVVWNQLVDSNTTSVTIASGHRYIAKINGTLTFGTSDGTAITVSANDYLTDLTAMFGTTIADYVYTLEIAEAGTGIAWLQSYGFFTEDYYAYKQNKLESGCVSAKKIYGKNLLPKATSNKHREVTYTVNADGSVSVSGTASGGTSLFDIGRDSLTLKSGTYYASITSSNATVTIFKITDGVASVLRNGVGSFTLTKTTSVFLRLSFADGTTASGTAYPQIEIGSSATSYEPYTETTYPISPITLRGLFKLSTDKLTVDGDEYNADGSVTRKYGIIDLGSCNVQVNTANSYLVTIPSGTYPDSKPNSNKALCTQYIYNGSAVSSMPDHTFKSHATQTRAFYFINESITSDATAMKQALSGVYLIYELATPTTEQTTPFTETEIVGSTEEFIDYEVAQGNRDVAIPVGTDTDYYQEMKLPSLPTTSGNHNLIYNVATGFGWT